MPDDPDVYVPLQAEYASSPWRVLVVCALLNLTSRNQIRPILPTLFDWWPNPSSLAEADGRLEALIAPLGLMDQRARRLRRMSKEFLEMDVLSPYIIENIHACGKYSADAFRVFVQGNLWCRPTDRVLHAYVQAVAGGV